MGAGRLISLDWIVELGQAPQADRKGSRQAFDRSTVSPDVLAKEKARLEMIEKEVERALGELEEDEREVVERFYYQGTGYRELSERSGRMPHRIEAIHRRAIRKLKRLLRPLVERLYEIEADHEPTERCPICQSIYRPQIDLIIKHKPDEETWTGIMKTLKHQFGIRIGSPQILIGHEKYH